MRSLVICIVMLLPVAAYSASADETSLRVYDTLASEYATCAAYHGILARSARDSGASATAAGHTMLRDKAITYALAFARKGHGELQARAVATQRIDAAIDGLFAEMGGDISAIPGLSGKYATHCRHALEDPGAFVDEVLARLTER